MKAAGEVTRGVETARGPVMPRVAIFLVTAAASASILAYGIFREEIGEVMFNAAML